MRLAAALLTLLLAGVAHAVGTPPEANVRSSIDPAIMKIDEARFLGQPLARETALLGEDGKRFFLGDMLGKPLILVLSYYGCDGSCPTVNQNLATALAQIGRLRSTPP